MHRKSNLTKHLRLARAYRAQHPEFPLTPHPCGQWTKKLGGATRYFGPLDDPLAAVERYRLERDYWINGEQPPSMLGLYTVGELLAAHKADTDARIAAGRLSRWSAKDHSLAASVLREADWGDLTVDALGPTDFARLRDAIAASGRALRSQKNCFAAIRTVFRWGERMELHQPVRFGPAFAAPTGRELTRDRERRGRDRFLNRDTIIAALDVAGGNLRVAILLGINCGFYASDTEQLTGDWLHLDAEPPYHDFTRPKTGARRVAVLWPETVAAIREHGHQTGAVLRTSTGRPYSAKAPGRSLSRQFEQLCRRHGIERPPGAGLGSLRHTFATVAGLSADQAVIDLAMGHLPGGSGSRLNLHRRFYSQRNPGELSRLQAVARIVRQWLYPATSAASVDNLD